MTPQLMVAVVLTVIMSFVASRISNRRKRRAAKSVLQQVLFRWPDKTPYRVNDLLRSCQIKGLTGSGKTSGSLMFLLRQIVAHPQSTFLLIAAKPEDRDEIAALFNKLGKPLLIVEPGSPWRCNLLETLRNAQVDDRGIAAALSTIGECLARSRNDGDSARFFELLESRTTQMCVGALRMAGEAVTAGNIRNFLSSAAFNGQTLGTEAYKQGYHCKVMKKAAEAVKPAIDCNDYEAIRSFFSSEFVYLDDKPRSGMIAGLQNTLFTLSTGRAWETLSTATKLGPWVIEDGFSVLVNYPYTEHRETGKLINAAFIYLWQHYILRRKWDGRFFNVIVMDEFQEQINEFMNSYLKQCRSHGGSMITATQTILSEMEKMGGNAAKSLIGQFGTHIFHTSDPETAEFASSLLGNVRETFVTVNPRPEIDIIDVWSGESAYSSSHSTQYQPLLQSNAFQANLRAGGENDRFIVDGVVVTPGRNFNATGCNYLFVEFRQEKS